MIKRHLLASALAVALLPATSPIHAEDYSRVKHNGLYIGTGYGLLKVKGDEEFDDDDSAARFFAGVQIAQSFAVEAGYLDFGKFGGNLASADIEGYSLAVKPGIPLGEWVTLYGQLGQLWWDADLKAVGASGQADGNELFYGLGTSFAVSKGFDIRVEYTRFNVEFEESEIGLFARSDDLDTDLDYVSAGIQYTF